MSLLSELFILAFLLIISILLRAKLLLSNLIQVPELKVLTYVAAGEKVDCLLIFFPLLYMNVALSRGRNLKGGKLYVVTLLSFEIFKTPELLL